MNLVCASCSGKFRIDEVNLDTDRVRCPHCEDLCPTRKENAHARRGRFLRQKTRIKENKSGIKWPGA